MDNKFYLCGNHNLLTPTIVPDSTILIFSDKETHTKMLICPSISLTALHRFGDHIPSSKHYRISGLRSPFT